MKHIIAIIISLFFSFSALAQWGGVVSSVPTFTRTYIGRASAHEFVQVYYYNNQNTIEKRRALLVASEIISSKRSDYKYGDYHYPEIWIYDEATNKVGVASGLLYLYSSGGDAYKVQNIELCNKKEPSNELEQRFTYKYLDKGIWYYFNAGLDLSLPSEKKSFIDRFKELLFK